MTRTLFVDGIAELLTCHGDGLGLVRDAAVVIEDGRVAYAGPAAEIGRPSDAEHVDARGRLVTPGLVEPHAHPIWAGARAHELALRASGATYLEIQAAGGGILSTVRATREATDEQLVASTEARLRRFLSHGTTFAEAKTGYALSVEGELRLLDLLRSVRGPVGVSPTLLAHVPSPDVPREAYVRDFCRRAVPLSRERCDAVDVYCDEGAFTLAETREILEAARREGLLLRVHAEQFTHTGAADLAAELGARSVEHMERPGEGTPERLAAAGTVVNLLPGAALTLKLPWPDARRFIAAGCKVALGTDCNPGSSLTESQPLMMSIAVMQMGMRVDEAWLGVTRHAAYAVNRPERGHLGAGAIGDLVIWQTDDHRELVQHLGGAIADEVIVAGVPTVSRS